MDLIASTAAFLAGNTLYVAPGATQCAAVRMRSRASAAPVQTLPPLAREPTTMTTDRAIPSPASVAPPTIAPAGLLNARDAARIRSPIIMGMKASSAGLSTRLASCGRGAFPCSPAHSVLLAPCQRGGNERDVARGGGIENGVAEIGIGVDHLGLECVSNEHWQ